MESINIFENNSDLWELVATKHNKTIKSIDEGVVVLQQWLQTQPHLPDLLNSNCLRNFLLLNKFSIEVTKQKIDNYYTIRKKFEEIYGKCSPGEEFNKVFCKMMYTVLYPKRTPEGYRIFCFKMRNDVLLDSFEPVDFIKRLVSIEDVRLMEDVTAGHIAIGDFKKFPIALLPKITPEFVYRGITLYEKIYSARLKGIYVVNVPYFATKVVALVKKFMKPKLANRIHMLKDADSLKELLSLDLIPEDFGGKGPSLDALQEGLGAWYQKHADFFDRLDEFEMDESLRPNKLENEDVFGFYGNFKKLDFD